MSASERTLLGVGAGGHARVVLEIVLLEGRWDPVALLDPRPDLQGSEILGVPVAGDDSLLPRYREDGVRHAFIGLAGTQDTRPRRRLCEHVSGLGYRIVSVVHPSAVVSAHADVGTGATILANAVVNAGAVLGEHVIVNSGAIVEHDCRVGDHVHVATGARLAGDVTVADGAHIGAGATVKQGVHIGAGSVIGIGAAVVADVPDGVVVAGVPATVRRSAAGCDGG